ERRVLTPRKKLGVTERPSTVEVGTNYLAGTDPEKIVAIAADILEGKGKKGQIPPLWDGKAAERIVEIILRDLQPIAVPQRNGTI
ncbi:MAG: UDP-N-acetylglucosamine 2-epimerase, partial [bacterium]|nr:UDP-N-acetylglucosamine 2-epimerase [bacterium]